QVGARVGGILRQDPFDRQHAFGVSDTGTAACESVARSGILHSIAERKEDANHLCQQPRLPGSLVWQNSGLPKRAESDRTSDGLHEATSRGLFQSCGCWRPKSLRGRTIHFSLRDRGGFREVRDEAARTGVAEGGTAGPYPDQFPSGGPALRM